MTTALYRLRPAALWGILLLTLVATGATMFCSNAHAVEPRGPKPRVKTYQITGEGQGTIIDFKGNLVFIDAVLLREMGLLETPHPSREQVQTGLHRLYRFYRESGYSLVRIKPQKRNGHWTIYIDEGLLDSIIVVGANWLNTYLVRRDLLPYDVFNSYRVKQWLGNIARTYKLKKVEYNVVTLHDDDAGAFEDNVGYLEHFADSFVDIKLKPRYRLEVIIHKNSTDFSYGYGLTWGSTYGLGAEGDVNFGSLVFPKDRLSIYAKVSGTRRDSLQPNGGTDTVITRAMLGIKSDTPPLGVDWLRIKLHSFAVLYNQQRPDIPLQQLMYLHSEHSLRLSFQITKWLEFSAFGGYDVRKIFDVEPVTSDPVTVDSRISHSGFTGGNLRFELAKPVLRRDLNDYLSLEGRAYFRRDTNNYYQLSLGYQQVFFFGASEAILRARGRFRFGDSLVTDQFPVAGDLMRASWGRYTLKAGHASAEARFSIYRQMVKFGLFNDMTLYGRLDRSGAETLVFADAAGPGLFFMFFDVFLLKMYYAVGIDTNADFAHTFSFSLSKVF